MQQVKVKIYNTSNNPNPIYVSSLSAGADIFAFIPELETIVIEPGERKLIPTGIYVGIPDGFEIQVRPRSGLALKKGISVLNTPGTIDGDYRGEVGVVLINNGMDSFEVNSGDRIAQIVLKRVPQIVWEDVNSLEALGSENRGGGWGHTGIA